MFDPLDKLAYISTPLPFRVNLDKSTWVPHATDSEADVALRQRLAPGAVPPRSVAETACIKSNRSTDLLALVKNLSLIHI